MQKEIGVAKRQFIFLIIFLVSSDTIFAQSKTNLKFYSKTCVRSLGSKLNSCQLFDPHQNPITGKKIVVDSDNKYDMPLGSRIGMNRLQVSNTRSQIHNNHPKGGALFPTEGSLASLLNTFLTSIDQDNYFLVYFGKIHLLILHEIYQYLMSIYVTFNMTHVQSIQEHLLNQTTQALNKKTMIVNHLLSVIEAQSNKAILTRFPNIPEHLATRMGKMMMKYDYGADLNLMMEKQEDILFAPYFNNPDNFKTNGDGSYDPELKNETEKNVKDHFKKRRELYTTIFGNYLKFFKSYTATLEQKDPIYGSAFVKHAQDIQKVIDAQPSHYSKVQKKLKGAPIKTKVQTLKDIKSINPPLFFYNSMIFRGMKLIPQLAKDLPKKSENVPWPKKLVEDAKSTGKIKNKFGNVISNVQPAYFEDANGKIIHNEAQAVSLYVNIPTIQNMYTQEVIPQPDWLNSYDGVMMMLRACLGDFTALFSPQLKDELIIDPCLACIILKAAQKAGISLPGTDLEGACSTCETYLESLQKILGWEKPITNGKPPPSDENGNSNGNGNDVLSGMPGRG